MAAIGAARTTVETLRRTPRLFYAGVAVAALIAPQHLLRLFVPLVPRLLGVLTFSVAVFVYAALFAAVAHATTGTASLDAAIEAGRERYLPLLGGKLIAAIAQVAWMAAIGGTAVATLVTVSESQSVTALLQFDGTLAEAILGSTAGNIGLVVVVTLLVAGPVAWFVVQFYDVAIVLGDGGIVDGFRQSVRIVEARPIAALGYTAIRVGVYALVAGLPWAMAILFAIVVPSAGSGVAAEMTVLIGVMVLGMVMTIVPVITTVVLVPLLGTDKVEFFEHVAESETMA
ncbi:MAG: hypothetical protein ABEJ86_03900 [Halococcoides sp.]